MSSCRAISKRTCSQAPSYIELGLWIIHPPSDVSSVLNTIVLDIEGQVMAGADSKGMFDVTSWGSSYRRLMLLTPLTDHICRAAAGVQDTVEFVHRIFHVPQPTLSLMADFIDDFPVSPRQIKNHLSHQECLCCLRGKMQNKPRRLDNMKPDRDDPLPPSPS